MLQKQGTFKNFNKNNINMWFNIKKFYVKEILLLFLIPFLLMGFKGIKYNTITKKIDGVEYNFQIPSTFCEYDVDVPDGVIQFLKCHQIELLKERQPVFFSERIYISYDTDQKNIQNVTDKFFANFKKQSYKNSSEEDKNAYLYSPIYPLKNKQKASIVNDTYIFERSGLNEDSNKYKNYEANLFLNKRNFTINWIQFLTQYEDFIEQDTFTDFVQDNKITNDKKIDFYVGENNQILIINEPRFGDFKYYTDIKKFNPNNSTGVFLKLASSEKNDFIQVLEISLMKQNLVTSEVYKAFQNDIYKNLNLNISLENYKDTDFIVLKKEGFIIYSCYINFSNNLTGFLIYRIPEEVGFKNGLSDICKYKKQLLEDNKKFIPDGK